MTLKIYNSLTKQKEEFKPLDPAGKEVKMYVCGPTVYDEPHIGHLRSAYVFEVIRNYLEYSGYKVKFVRNVTDVDDKIIEKARQNDASDLLAEVKNVSEKYLQAYKKDLAALGIQEPIKEPKATAHIEDMIRLIQKLLKNGFAYESQGDVYYEVNAFKDYGKLSHQKKDQMLENVRIDANEKKKNPLDFALWKKSKEDEPSWESPWGKGRPGWHIECSAMSMKYLGETFDIHGGGRDLIFPHHENEIAQSETANGKQFARYWIHHGLITVNEQKMSKSLKNFITLSALISSEKSKIDDLKFLFLGTHYSAPLDYSEAKMEMERSIKKRFLVFLDLAKAYESNSSGLDEPLKDFKARFQKAMGDDFNTPLALAVMHEMVHHAYQNQQNTDLFASIAQLLEEFGTIFGIFSDPAEDRDFEEFVNSRISLREEAKKNKDFVRADEIRKDLLMNYRVAIMDTSSGPKWSRA